MTQVIPSRQLFSLLCEGAWLHGTYHVPAADRAVRSQTGLLILAGFPMPRSAHGDAAVYWANGFAAQGFPAFRIDLPGLGDSYGNVPAELLPFTANGGFERFAAAAVRQIVERYQLRGLVILGQCAGSITAVFAAAVAQECSGLVLLDPPFYLPPQRKPKLKRAIYHLLTSNPITSRLLRVSDRWKQMRSHLRGQAALPENANTPMLTRWKSLANSGLPILLLNAPEPGSVGANPRVGRFNYLAHILILAGRNSKVDSRTVEGANHSFSNEVGKSAVPLHVSQWMATVFPLHIAASAPLQAEAATSQIS